MTSMLVDRSLPSSMVGTVACNVEVLELIIKLPPKCAYF